MDSTFSFFLAIHFTLYFNAHTSVSHKSVRLLIESTAKSLADDIQFTYARTSDFNVMRDKKYPFITLDPLNSVPQFTQNGVTYIKAWSCNMAFYQLDKEGSIQDEYAVILDQMSNYVDKFVNKLNLYSYQSDIITIENINQTAFIKATADTLTGYLLTFTLLAQDDFDYCADDLDCVTRTNEC